MEGKLQQAPWLRTPLEARCRQARMAPVALPFIEVARQRMTKRSPYEISRAAPDRLLLQPYRTGAQPVPRMAAERVGNVLL